MKTDEFRKELPVKLTDEQWRRKAETLAETMGKHEELEDELDDVKKDYKHRMSVVESEISQLRRQVETHSEIMEVECERLWDFPENTVRDRRCDTGEVFFERAMTSSERQLELGEGE